MATTPSGPGVPTGRSRRHRVGRGVRACAVVLGAVVVAGASAGCQPRDGEATVDNRTTETLVLRGETIRPGERERIYLDSWCEEIEMVSENLAFRVPSRRLCDDDTFTVRDEHLVPLTEFAVVVNESDVDVDVLFGSAELRLGPGERARLLIPPKEGTCSDSTLIARAAGTPDPPVVFLDGPLCVGAEWVLTDASVAGEPATVTISNRTEYALLVQRSAVWDDEVLDTTVPAGEDARIAIRTARGTCTRYVSLVARTSGGTGGPPRTDYGPQVLCDGDTWQIDAVGVDRDHLDRRLPLTLSVTNGTEADVRLTADDREPVVIAPGQDAAIDLLGDADGCGHLRLTADVTGAVRPQYATGLIRVCDGARGVVTLEGIEILAPEESSPTP